MTTELVNHKPATILNQTKSEIALKQASSETHGQLPGAGRSKSGKEPIAKLSVGTLSMKNRRVQIYFSFHESKHVQLPKAVVYGE